MTPIQRQRRCAYLAFAVVVAAAFLASGSRAENVSGNFSETPMGARNIGLGGAFVAIADDAYAQSVNPAGLALMDRISVTFDYSNLFGLGLLKQSYFGGVFPTRWGTHALSYQGLQVEFKPFPQTLQESTLSYSYAKSIGPWAVGLTLKYMDLTSDFQEGTGTGFGFDVGARYQLTTRWSFGGSIRNLYSNVNYGTGTSEAVPASWRLGAAYRVSDRWTASGEWSGLEGDFFSRFRAGTEYWILRPAYMLAADRKKTDSIFGRSDVVQYPVSLAVRGGFEKQFSGGNRTLPAIGLTGGYGDVRLDYAYAFENKGLGATHHFSLTYDFTPWAQEPSPGSPAAEEAAPSGAGQVAQAIQRASPRTVAVLDFANATGDPSLGWLEIGLADIVAKELAGAGFQVVPRTQLAGTSSLAGPEIITLAQQLQARLVVRGLFVRSAGGMVLTARIIDGSTGRTLDFVEAQAAETDIFAIGKSIGQGITAKAGAWMQ